eukprot:6290850-Prymnesium_polylepis.1
MAKAEDTWTTKTSVWQDTPPARGGTLQTSQEMAWDGSALLTASARASALASAHRRPSLR